MDDPLVIAGRSFTSRLIIGTGGIRNLEALEQAIVASGAEMATVAMRRVSATASGSIIDVIEATGCSVLPNTAGCFTAHDAITTARLAREALETDWVKLEVIGDDKTLLPDPVELLPGDSRVPGADDLDVGHGRRPVYLESSSAGGAGGALDGGVGLGRTVSGDWRAGR